MNRSFQFNLQHYAKIRNSLMFYGSDYLHLLPPKDFDRLKMKLCKKPDNIRHAAVFIPLCNTKGRASVLFTLRTDKVSTHKGEVSFPGGHIELNETASDAAVRETIEEIGGWFSDKLVVLGETGPVWSRAGTCVHPVIGYVKEDLGDMSQLTISESEVSSVFTIPVEDLLSAQSYKMTNFSPWGMQFSWPEWHSGPAKIWGMTSYILYAALMRVVVPSCNLQHLAPELLRESIEMHKIFEDKHLIDGFGLDPKSGLFKINQKM